jgi:hypothetical protein
VRLPQSHQLLNGLHSLLGQSSSQDHFTAINWPCPTLIKWHSHARIPSDITNSLLWDDKLSGVFIFPWLFKVMKSTSNLNASLKSNYTAINTDSSILRCYTVQSSKYLPTFSSSVGASYLEPGSLRGECLKCPTLFTIQNGIKSQNRCKNFKSRSIELIKKNQWAPYKTLAFLIFRQYTKNLYRIPYQQTGKRKRQVTCTNAR